MRIENTMKAQLLAVVILLVVTAGSALAALQFSHTSAAPVGTVDDASPDEAYLCSDKRCDINKRNARKGDPIPGGTYIKTYGNPDQAGKIIFTIPLHQAGKDVSCDT
jgi:hypothetical protein